MERILYVLFLGLFSFLTQAQGDKIISAVNPYVSFGTEYRCSKINADVIVNGPFLRCTGEFIGELSVDGKLLSKAVNPYDRKFVGTSFEVDNGFFGEDYDGNYHMVTYDESKKLPKMKWTFQNGPILVKDGKNIRTKTTNKCVRSGMGYANNTLYVILTGQKVTLNEFANKFINLGVQNAIYLDGGPYVGYSDSNTPYPLTSEEIDERFTMKVAIKFSN